MAFPAEVQKTVTDYVENHLPNEEFYQSYFWFITDENLKNRLEEEFRSARYIYKMLEGMQAKDWLLTAQIRVQILQYASIYEAVLHHVLFQNYQETSEVSSLSTYEHRKPINVAGHIKQKIQDTYNPTGSIMVYETENRSMDERKIIFEDKAHTALNLGLISEKIRTIVCSTYSLRNAIHLHAEIRRGINYEIETAKDAYWYLKGFCEEISRKLIADGKVITESVKDEIC